MSALRLKGSSLAGVAVVLLPPRLRKSTVQKSWASSLSRNMLVTALSQSGTDFFTNICTELKQVGLVSFCIGAFAFVWQFL